MSIFWYVLEINPEPWKVGPVSVGRKNGKIFPMVGRDQQLYNYQMALKDEFKRIYGEVTQLDRDMKFTLTAYFWRNRAEYTTQAQREHRKHEADGTNLYKATEDAMQGVLYKNDLNNINGNWIMMDQGPEAKSLVVLKFDTAPSIISAYMEFPSDVLDKARE